MKKRAISLLLAALILAFPAVSASCGDAGESVLDLGTDAVSRSISVRRTKDGTDAVTELTIPGSEIIQDEPTQEQLEEDRKPEENFFGRRCITALPQNRVTATGFSYKWKTDYNDGILDKTVLQCYFDGELKWTADLQRANLTRCVHTGAGTAVWGYNFFDGGNKYAWIGLIDEEGTLLWKQSGFRHGFERFEYVNNVFDNGGGTWTAFSTGDNRYTCAAVFDVYGNELKYTKSDVGNYTISYVERSGDGYIVVLSDYPYMATIALTDADGKVTDTFSIENDECAYYISDIAVAGGRVYISAYAVQITGEGKGETAALINGLHESLMSMMTPTTYGIIHDSPELTRLIRDKYTAVLFICGEDAVPEAFFSVKGSLGGELTVNDDGRIEWETDSIVGSGYSAETSAFTITEVCTVFRHTFGADGKLQKSVDTGKVISFAI